MLTRSRVPRASARLAVFLAVFLLGSPLCAAGVGAGSAASASGSSSYRPLFEWKKSAALLLAGGIPGLIAQRTSVDQKDVPPGGLDPSAIHFGIDRDALGHHSTRALDRSNLLRNASLGFAVLLPLISTSGDDRWWAVPHRAFPFFESTALAGGWTELLKRSVSRPRPYLYHTEGQRAGRALPSGSGGGMLFRIDLAGLFGSQVPSRHPDNDFLSFPSGHASASFTAASFAVTDHLFSRPHADWKEHAAVSLLGSLLATETAAMRVEGGVHFPTDVAAGAALGILCGAGVPLLHHYVAVEGRTPGSRAPRPPGSSILAASGGAVVGVVVAILLAPAVAGQ